MQILYQLIQGLEHLCILLLGVGGGLESILVDTEG